MHRQRLQYHSRDLRKGRWSSSGQHYLLTAVIRERRPVFQDFWAARICINELRGQHYLGAVSSLAFVIMPDHFHWLIELRQSSLATVMQVVKGRTARRVNLHLGLRGSLWQSGYHDRGLRSDEDLRAMARYMVANPLRAELVKDLLDYPHWDAMWMGGGGERL